jgi:hypothetical protein
VTPVRVQERPTTRRPRIDRPAVRPPGWQVVLAAHGEASARPSAPGSPPGILVGEGPRTDHPPPAGRGRQSQTEVLLGHRGDVVVRSVAAPPVLLLNAWGDVVRPVAGLCGLAAVRVETDGLLFVCTPSLLEALDPAELIAAPRLLWAAPAPAVLLDRWLCAADRHGVAGAAAAVARFGAARVIST